MRKPSDESEQVGLELLAEALELEAVDPRVRAALIEAWRGRERWTPFAGDVARHFDLTLDDARSALRMIHDESAWRPGLWPGSTLLSTPALTARQAVIARMPRGLNIPLHRHQTRERTYILDGALLEDERVRHGSGQLVDMPIGSEHRVTVASDSDCLVVFSVSKD